MRYPVLRFITIVLRVWALLLFITALVTFIMGAAAISDFMQALARSGVPITNELYTFALFLVFISFLGSVAWCIGLYARAEWIKVQLDIEANTRRAADATAYQANSSARQATPYGYSPYAPP